MLFEGPVPGRTPTPRHQNEVDIAGELNASRPETVLRLPDGRTVVLPTDLLLSGLPPHAPVTAEPGASAVPTPTRANATSSSENSSENVIPLIAEEAQIGKQTVTTGTVRIHRSTESFAQTVGLPLTRTSYEVERVAIGQLYTERPEVRQEGTSTIYPLVEERLVAKREYFLIEEVHVKQVAVTTERSATLELKRDVLTVERDTPAPV